MTALPAPEQQKAFADYRAALAKVNAHDRMKSFETIRAICDRALEWGPEYEDEARLALAYALDGVLDVDQTQIEELEDERSEEDTSELQSLMRITYAVFCLK